MNTTTDNTPTQEEIMKFAESTALLYFNHLVSEREKVENQISENESLIAQLGLAQKSAVGEEWSRIFKQKQHLVSETKMLSKVKMNYDNLFKAMTFGGSFTGIADTSGQEYFNIADFRKVSKSDFIFNEEDILEKAVPHYIPVVDQETFARKGYVFDTVRIARDSYLLCTNGFNIGENNQFVILTLDQLVLTVDYYFRRAKAEKTREAKERTQRSEAHYDSLPEPRRQAHLFQANYYRILPVAVKKKVTEEEWNALDLPGKEAFYKPYKRYAPKKLTAKLGKDEMWMSYHRMYQLFVDSTAYPIDRKSRQPIKRIDVPAYEIYANPIVSLSWQQFREMLNYKIKDIEFQREEVSQAYEKAIETSFGDSNTSDLLFEKYGVMVKRQNGDPIMPVEIAQIANALDIVQDKFGNLRQSFEKHAMKISHSGAKNIFARKAIGIFIPDMHTIGISNKYGELEFQSTTAHELAHFIDFCTGFESGNRYATDDYESTAGRLAFEFRNGMNISKELQTDYTNATKECFARALQQYFSIETYGPESGTIFSIKFMDDKKPFFLMDDYVPETIYYDTIRPLIIRFFQENESLFSIIADQEDQQQIESSITGLQLLLETETDYDEQTQISNTIEALRLL